MAASLTRVTRNISTLRVLRSSLTEPLKPTAGEADHGSYKMWRSIFFFCCCPAICVATLNAFMMEEHPRPEFVKYPHLRIRNKQYPWRDGVKTLFHNPHRNALPDGYEE